MNRELSLDSRRGKCYLGDSKLFANSEARFRSHAKGKSRNSTCNGVNKGKHKNIKSPKEETRVQMA